ncbi:hypothetical protein [Oerskovia enterophila]|uniref:Uncharacterized protein n=1 Tax=Oerskovia enterophila TaxID=43678 RepID=A0A161XCZ5_9CELL|nr:hypothetical protein [Oerskovia enterophila]KZM34517.1 hypothetical protein OJAG_28160 [Oerskovia enterophila]
MSTKTTARHRGPVNMAGEIRAYDLAATGQDEALRGRHHKPGVAARVRCLRNAWESSAERRVLNRKAAS